MLWNVTALTVTGPCNLRTVGHRTSANRDAEVLVFSHTEVLQEIRHLVE